MLAPTHASRQRDLLCSGPVDDLDSAAGVLVRTAGDTWAREAEAVGVAPVGFRAPGLYEAFQRGLVTCALVHPPVFIDYGLWELGDYYAPLRFSDWNAANLAVALDFWGLSMPADGRRPGLASDGGHLSDRGPAHHRLRRRS